MLGYKNAKATGKNNYQYFIFTLILILTITTALYGQYTEILRFVRGEIAYQTFPISEWMINYEGGFTRRGLVGQVLHLFYTIHPYNFPIVIAAIYYASFIIFTLLIIRIFRKNGWSPYLLAFTPCLYYSMESYFIASRRDFITLSLILLIYFLFFSLLRRQSLRRAIPLQLVSCITILLYEPAFFLFVPLCFIIHWYYRYNKGESAIKSLAFTTCYWIPSVATMAAVCLARGTDSAAIAIWQSWQDGITRYTICQDNGSIGNGPAFFTVKTVDAITNHFKAVWQSTLTMGIPSAPFNLYNFACIYYLVTRLNTIDLSFYPLRKIDNIALSNTVLLQFVFLTPLFGFLTCDMGRSIPFWTLSSLMFYHFFNTTQAFPKFITNASQKIQGFIDNTKCLNSPITYCLLLVSLPLTCWRGAALACACPFIPYSWRIDFMLWLQHVL